MTTFVFPGQGSQKKGMGGTLFDEFKEITAKADEVLGHSIKQLCLEDPGEQLNNTLFTQPALYTVNALNYLRKIMNNGKQPDYVAGHSLGEYNALFAAGAFEFETGLKLVKKRGELMSQAKGGGMAAVIGLTKEKIMDIFRKKNMNRIQIANYNTPSQLVLSGPRTDIDSAQKWLELAGGSCIPLSVSGAFHSSYMNEAKEKFAAYIESFTFSEPTIPVISNVHARPYGQGEVKENLIGQITRPVRWTESVQYLLNRGEMEFEEIGPGSVLTRLIQAIRKQDRTGALDTTVSVAAN